MTHKKSALVLLTSLAVVLVATPAFAVCSDIKTLRKALSAAYTTLSTANKAFMTANSADETQYSLVKKAAKADKTATTAANAADTKYKKAQDLATKTSAALTAANAKETAAQQAIPVALQNWQEWTYKYDQLYCDPTNFMESCPQQELDNQKNMNQAKVDYDAAVAAEKTDNAALKQAVTDNTNAQAAIAAPQAAAQTADAAKQTADSALANAKTARATTAAALAAAIATKKTDKAAVADASNKVKTCQQTPSGHIKKTK